MPVTVGGVVSASAPAAAGELGVAPVGVVVGVAVAAVGDDQTQLRAAGQTHVRALVGGRAEHDTAVEEQRRVAVDLEHHRAVAADFVVDADDRGGEGAAAGRNRVAQIGRRVHAEPFGEHLPADSAYLDRRRRRPVRRCSGRAGRPPAVDRGGRREIADVGRRGGAAGGGR